MNNYTIIKTNAENYANLILCLSFESLQNYIKEIEKSLSQNKDKVKVLIDQLLITGNGSNRFMSCDFYNGKFDFKTAQIVEPTNYFRKESVGWLHNNYCYVENSILTEEQRQKIKENVAF